MTQVTQKPKGSSTVIYQPTPYIQDEKMQILPSTEVQKKFQGDQGNVRVNKHIQAMLTRKASQKAPISENLKKIRGSKPCSHCSKMNEELNQYKPVEDPEVISTPAIPVGQVVSQ